jgi:hypothetical protein
MQVKRRRILALSLIASLFISVVYLLGWSTFFEIKQVEIRTSDEANRTLIAGRLANADLGLEIGDSMGRINVRAINRFLGEVAVERNWFKGVVSISVSERTPLMSIERFAKNLGQTQTTREFMDEGGTLFSLPGDLASKYRGVPLLRLESDDFEMRLSALRLFGLINQSLPTREITATSLATLVSESQVGGGAGDGSRSRWIEIKWGSGDEIELKLEVVTQLLQLKGNRNARTIDVSNPELPIVS